MRIYLVIIWILIFPGCIYSQLFTTSDYYAHNALAINPAFAGSHEALSATMLHRRYNAGFEGSPTNLSLSVHTPFKYERIGLGFLLLTDNIGITKRTNFMGNYAYRIDMGDGKLSFGLGIGLTFQNNDWSQLAARDEGDILLADNYASGIMPNFSTGIYYSSPKYFAGFSVPLFLTQEYDENTGNYAMNNNIREYNYFFNAGGLFPIDTDIKLFPSVLIRYHSGIPTQIDLKTQLIFKDRFWVGTGYRSKNNVIAMLQYQVNDQFRIGYSYNYNTGNKMQFNSQSQEIMLHYVLNFSAVIPGPRQF